MREATAGARQRARPVFVVGAPRSGTTLSARILGAHPALFAPGETHYMEDVYSRKELGKLADPAVREALVDRLSTIYARFNEPNDQRRVESMLADPDGKQALLDASASHADALSSFMSMQAHLHGASRWVNHTPKDLFYVSDLLVMFPDAKFVFCVRDPRDFLLSYKGKWRATTDDQVARIKSLYHPITTTLLWKASALRIRKGLASLPADQVHLVRYESLVSEPEPTVRELCEFIGEDYVPSMLDISFTNSSHADGAEGIHTASIGRGVKELRAAETWWCEHLLKEQLEEFGYAPSSPSPGFGSIILQALTFPVATVRALVANRHNTGPVIPYLVRRLQSFLRSA